MAMTIPATEGLLDFASTVLQLGTAFNALEKPTGSAKKSKGRNEKNSPSLESAPIWETPVPAVILVNAMSAMEAVSSVNVSGDERLENKTLKN